MPVMVNLLKKTTMLDQQAARLSESRENAEANS